MISLLWKEWKQNRLIFALGLLVPVLFCILYATHPRHLYIKAVDVPATLYIIGVLYALLIGSLLISQEIGSGTISELFARPVNPWKVWLSKFLFGLLTTAAVILFAVVLGLIVASRVDGIAVTDMWSRSVGKTPVTLLILIPPAVLAVALFASNMTEQPILAILGAVIAAAFYAAYWGGWELLLSAAGAYWYGSRLSFLVSGARLRMDLSVAMLEVISGLIFFAAVSGWIYAKGQLHTGLRAPRWRLAGTSIGCLALICVISLVWGYADILHLGPYEDFTVRGFLVSPDAQKVAMQAHARNAELVGTVWIVDLESGERLFRDHYLDPPSHWWHPHRGAAWSPDSSRFAMLVEPSYPRVWLRFGSEIQRLQVLDVEEQTVRTLKAFGPDGSWPYPLLAWSRAGDTLYCFVMGGAGGPLENISLDGTVLTRGVEADRPVSNVYPIRVVGTDPPLFFCQCAVSRQYEDRHTAYALVDPATGETEVIDLGREDEVAFLDISPDGRYILYEKYGRPLKLGEKAGVLKGPPSRLFLRDLSTGTDRPLLEDRAWRDIVRFYWGVFSPDGTRFVIQERRPGKGAETRIDVYIVDIMRNRLNRLMEITEWTQWIGHMCWSPDSSRLALTVGLRVDERSRLPEPADLHVITVRENQITKTVAATAEMGRSGAFAWLSNDELLYGDGNAVYRIKVDGTDRRKVFP